MTLNDESFAVCLDCGKRLSYDLQPLRSGIPSRNDNPGTKRAQAHERAAGGIAESGNLSNPVVDHGSASKRSLAKGLGILIGECGFGVNGPLLFNRLGINVPESAAIGCLVGAAIGYAFVDITMRLQNRMGAVTPAPTTAQAQLATKADYSRNGAPASVPSNPRSSKVKERLIETIPLRERVRQRANQLYVARGRQAGSQLDDWLQAEEEILHAHEDALVDEASDGSFPASDPPAYLAASVID